MSAGVAFAVRRLLFALSLGAAAQAGAREAERRDGGSVESPLAKGIPFPAEYDDGRFKNAECRMKYSINARAHRQRRIHVYAKADAAFSVAGREPPADGRERQAAA